ncbi:MAG: DUF739 family protein [Lachnospiraceae bacterium]|uniref:DUF739 family protein n=1 Tax=Galactobacillus timonensis TaxID=2041840 RepID=UPI0023EF670D|nr:DUF739 family protein [Galactobacillus timonensis]MDD7086648.1 DUF739 family protein [Galactobacillus timonensis]MDY5221981.1 DUF739 family protein [Lachnospiraceae bacterium]
MSEKEQSSNRSKTNSRELEVEITRKGMTVREIARQMGITEQSFYNKLNNRTEFKASEIQILCDILGLSDMRLFFYKET